MHAIRSWRDLKNRLDSDRRCYAFFHPRMPGEPLIFVEVALVKGLAGSVQGLLDEKAPVQDPREADTAIFYSISNCQQGLAGISFGNFLIKRVVEVLSAEFRNLKAFATLSPIPGFRRWLDEKLAADEPGPAVGEEAGEPRLGDADRVRRGVAGGDPGQARLVARGRLAQDRRAGAGAAVCPLPAGRERNGKKRARDPVAHFHLSNGARVERHHHAGRHVGEGRQGERHADGELSLRSGEDRGVARGLCR